MSRNTAMWGGIAAGAALGAGVLFGMDLSGLVDPAFSTLGAVDATSFADALNGSGFEGFDSSDADFSSLGDQQDANPGDAQSQQGGYPHQGTSVVEHLNNAFHAFGGGAMTQPAAAAGGGPLINRNGLPILRRLDLTNLHSCNHCGDNIFGTRLKCLQCPDFDSCTKETCLALVDHRHTPGHSFLLVPQAGNYVVLSSKGMSAYCQGCQQGVPGKQFFSCLACPNRIDYCPSCFTQGRHKQHLVRSPQHLFIKVSRGGFVCDGCAKEVSDLPWFECAVCGGDDYGLCVDCYPRAVQLHPQHAFRRTFGCEPSNVSRQLQQAPPQPPPAHQPYTQPASQQHPQIVGIQQPSPPYTQAHPGQYRHNSGITCGRCRRFTVGQWWVCNLCPDNTVCNDCIRPAHAYHGHSFTLVRH